LIFQHSKGLKIRIDANDNLSDVVNKILQIELVNGKPDFNDMDYTLEVYNYAKTELDRISSNDKQ
jgi:hypothetical protein